MARKPPASKDEALEIPGILPIPAQVIRHHGPSVFAAMREWAVQKRVPPTLLFTGTAGSGKRHMAYWLAQWILCEQSGFGNALGPPEGSHGASHEDDPFTASLFGDAPSTPEPQPPHGTERPLLPASALEPGPCGQCTSCQRAVRGNWVDFSEVLPEDSDGDVPSSGTLKVDQFRGIKQRLGFGAHEGAYRIILIPNADRMTVQAANSVLKLLEEPPPGWVFFLTASDPTLVLPTILSRCQQLRLRPFQPRDLEELLALAGVAPPRAKLCAELAQGSWSKALALSSDEIWEHRQTLFGFLKEPASGLAPLVDWASQEPQRFDLLVDQLEQLTSELIRWSISRESESAEITRALDAYAWVSSDGRAALASHAKAAIQRQGDPARARRFWIERAERLARARQEALAPLNRKLLIQDLLLPWLQAV